ncbi:hypothetical protein PVK06_042687 [Gossypium arboreum]|uniref:Uncharacterized protein n=1 Tax=Gossypium arboreum TaxID=29729 RepID=A0ABR0MLD9_GOSAR|nr:hypothetical protein PVK06_042687 [Gossypium arboreum]
MKGQNLEEIEPTETSHDMMKDKVFSMAGMIRAFRQFSISETAERHLSAMQATCKLLQMVLQGDKGTTHWKYDLILSSISKLCSNVIFQQNTSNDTSIWTELRNRQDKQLKEP